MHPQLTLPLKTEAHDPMMMEDTTTTTTVTATITAALNTLSPPQHSHLTLSILYTLNRHNHRLSLLLSSPILFSLSLRHLLSLSLHQKSLLIARHLLSSLHILTRHLNSPPLPSSFPPLSLRDLDALLLLLVLCELRHHSPQTLDHAPPSQWRAVLRNLCSDHMLSLSGIGVLNGGVLIPYIEDVVRCWRYVSAMEEWSAGAKADGEAAAAVRAVLALPSVEVRGGGNECAICREEMGVGRDVCELPCGHLYHWLCILPWLKKRNTCPCCRYQMPSDDVLAEIGRLWGVLIKVGGGRGTHTRGGTGELLCT